MATGALAGTGTGAAKTGIEMDEATIAIVKQLDTEIMPFLSFMIAPDDFI
jgi:hypothetical protein